MGKGFSLMPTAGSSRPLLLQSVDEVAEQQQSRILVSSGGSKVPWDMSNSTLAATDCSARLPWCSSASKGFRPLSCNSPALAAGC